jgi:hypothetical protein
MMINDKEIIEQLTAERDAALSQVEQLRVGIRKIGAANNSVEEYEAINFALDMLGKTPAQCLAEIKAQQPQPDDWKKKIDKARDEAKAALDEWTGIGG